MKIYLIQFIEIKKENHKNEKDRVVASVLRYISLREINTAIVTHALQLLSLNLLLYFITVFFHIFVNITTLTTCLKLDRLQ